ncbi:hypothetical protein EBB07_31150 [Paenibacillaceae bacterium]|nr:hypothetical protein EBB07_31150 [Paenibacillaceae bacterium]
MNNIFKINIINQRFLNDNLDDVCSHGEIFLLVGNVIISDSNDGEWNINESALSLMRSVKYGFPTEQSPPQYYPTGFPEDVLINHCGVYMMFCPTTITWKVRKQDEFVILSGFVKNEQIKYDSLIIRIPFREYASQIYQFAIEAKLFFSVKEIKYKDWELEEGMYERFWEEFNELIKYLEEEVGIA